MGTVNFFYFRRQSRPIILFSRLSSVNDSVENKPPYLTITRIVTKSYFLLESLFCLTLKLNLSVNHSGMSEQVGLEKKCKVLHYLSSCKKSPTAINTVIEGRAWKLGDSPLRDSGTCF